MTKLLRSCWAAIVTLPFLSGAIINYGQAPISIKSDWRERRERRRRDSRPKTCL
jgi:hypothetical protein